MSICVCYAQIKAIEIPFDREKEILIDGNIEDWSWVDDKYKLYSDNFFNITNNSLPDTSSFSIELFVAWSQIKNKVFIVAKVKDNELINGEGLNIAVNPTNAQGHYWVNDAPAHFNVVDYYFELRDTKLFPNVYLGPEWLAKKNHLFAVNINSSKTEVSYEISFPLWDSWNDNINLSKRHRLNQEEKIGLMLVYTDIDSDQKIQWANVYEKECWNDANSIGNTTLLLPNSSGKIKLERLIKVSQ